MLQQTQAPRVVPKFVAFLARFPTIEVCAAASVGEVVDAWHGLGYNRRAVNLHRAAVIIDERHGGVLPDDLDALLALPGIGPYTARAVLVFAFEHDLGLVDTNAGRFVSRALAGRPLDLADAQRLADGQVPHGQAWAWGQAVFDLGAAVCTKRAPACGACPIAASCAWALAGWPEPDPVIGSAGVTKGQSTFAGSFRQGRGRLVAALRSGPVGAEAIAVAAGWPDDQPRAAQAVASLVADGLAVVDDDGTVMLP
ncbi:MAG: A/G-specific adenine glycosylase [Acidimicrobiaceae bacterium]|jgi:A/G-specific adenine glycosylase